MAETEAEARRVDRNLYIPDMVDRAKVISRAEYLAIHSGERVVVHEHAHGQNCADACNLYYRIFVIQPWSPDAPT